MIPSRNRKVICGQNNYLGMVTIYKMSENEMGNRGSKSILKTNIVKEQRVDGSWGAFNFKNIKEPLRCTLMGGESHYQIKIPSNQINKIINRNYTSNSYSPSPSTFPICLLDPYFVIGFSYAEVSFIVLILNLKEPKIITNWTVKIRFSISLHKKDTEILELIKFYFGGAATISGQNEKKVFNIE
uniref:Homing endonuclease LAGLIDADG domain-containing protein n=1 Tax=Lentinula edodes TaxID=5353 RepID=A0A5C1VD56_LENED|nr:hypothetical protein [Lentinula edodes]WGO76449.1 LAGLIDADG homing endonuclease [Lentinula edodes]